LSGPRRIRLVEHAAAAARVAVIALVIGWCLWEGRAGVLEAAAGVPQAPSAVAERTP
jgi:hypothetical protein